MLPGYMHRSQPQDLLVISYVQTSCNRFVSYDTIPLYRRCRSGGMGVGLVRSKCPSVPGVFMMIPFPLFGFEIHSTLRLK